MGVDFGGPALEVAIGLAFVFFLLSTVASAITEGIAWAMKQRAKQFEHGLLGLLGENDFAKSVLEHALVQSDARKPKKSWWKLWEAKRQKPSYASARNFSLALIDTLSKKGEQSNDHLQKVESGLENQLAEMAPTARTQTKAENGNADPKGIDALGQQLGALLGDPEVARLEDFRKAAEKWFDDAMDRVSGWYKRWAQLITCLVAIVVTVGLNVNAIKVAETLANEPTVRAAVAGRAESASQGSPADAGKDAQTAVKELESLKLPILWSSATDKLDLSLLAGWLVTAIAISLGAPFWFDALGKLARLRTTGKKPKPEPEPEPLVVVNPPVLSAGGPEAPA